MDRRDAKGKVCRKGCGASVTSPGLSPPSTSMCSPIGKLFKSLQFEFFMAVHYIGMITSTPSPSLLQELGDGAESSNTLITGLVPSQLVQRIHIWGTWDLLKGNIGDWVSEWTVRALVKFKMHFMAWTTVTGFLYKSYSEEVYRTS